MDTQKKKFTIMSWTDPNQREGSPAFPTTCITGLFSSRDEACRKRASMLRFEADCYQAPGAEKLREEIYGFLAREQYVEAFDHWNMTVFVEGLKTVYWTFHDADLDV